MKMKKRIVALVFAALPLVSWAAPPSEESVRKLLEVTHAEASLKQASAMIEPIFRKAINDSMAPYTATPLTDRQKRILATLPERLGKLLLVERSPDQILPFMAKAYRETFDQSEIDGLIAFYQTPVGQSYIQKTPIFTQKWVDFAMNYNLQVVQPKVRDLIQQVLKEAGLPPPHWSSGVAVPAAAGSAASAVQ